MKPNFDVSTDAGSLFDILKMYPEMTNSNMYNIVDEWWLEWQDRISGTKCALFLFIHYYCLIILQFNKKSTYYIYSAI